jgi:hypothetical protein
VNQATEISAPWLELLDDGRTPTDGQDCQCRERDRLQPSEAFTPCVDKHAGCRNADRRGHRERRPNVALNNK